MNEAGIRDALKQLGYGPVEKPWGLLVRLPMWCDLRIRLEGDGPPRIQPYFGSTPRTLHSWLMPVLYLLLVIVFLQNPGFDVPHMTGLLTLILLGSAWDICRYIVTEGAMTRIATCLAVHGSVNR